MWVMWLCVSATDVSGRAVQQAAGGPLKHATMVPRRMSDPSIDPLLQAVLEVLAARHCTEQLDG